MLSDNQELLRATTPIKSFPLIASPVRDGKRFPVTMVDTLVAGTRFQNKVQSKTDLFYFFLYVPHHHVYEAIGFDQGTPEVRLLLSVLR